MVCEDGADKPAIPVEFSAPCLLPLQQLDLPRVARFETEWIMPTSGTSGPPKLVVHTLRTLMAAISDAPLQRWATFYDIRRYGGLQIFLRALTGRGSLSLGESEESMRSLLARFGAARITHISGTPSHWRKVLISGEGRRIDPDYIRLSGEIADDALLRVLSELYPRARIEHAYASTEAGVVFAVDDRRSGFPASWLEDDRAVQMKVVYGALCVRSDRCALRFAGRRAPPLADRDGFVDTGDMVEQVGDRSFCWPTRRGHQCRRSQGSPGGGRGGAQRACGGPRQPRVRPQKPNNRGARFYRGSSPRGVRRKYGLRTRYPRCVQHAIGSTYGSGRIALRHRLAYDRWRKARHGMDSVVSEAAQQKRRACDNRREAHTERSRVAGVPPPGFERRRRDPDLCAGIGQGIRPDLWTGQQCRPWDGRPLENMSDTEIDALVRINTLLPILLSKCVVRGMIAEGHGRVINVCSIVCAVRRRRFPVGASPTRRTLQPEATGAVMEVTKWLKPSV